jgi:hypothetical protein
MSWLVKKRNEAISVTGWLKTGKMPAEIPNQGVPFLKGKFPDDRRAAGVKNQELDLRHTPLSLHERKSFNSVH